MYLHQSNNSYFYNDAIINTNIRNSETVICTDNGNKL